MTIIFRADHVGSLLRPPELLAARDAQARGELDPARVRTLADRAILGALDMQRTVGLPVCSDGEFRRSSWMGGLYEVLEGVTAREDLRLPPGAWKGVGAEEANSYMPIPHVAATSKLRLRARFTGEDTAFLKAHARLPWKITMPSPTMMLSLFHPAFSSLAYASQEALLADLVQIYQREVDGQIADGAAYVQLDSLRYAHALSRSRPDVQTPAQIDAAVAQTLQADNAVLSRCKDHGVIRAVHICRGNHRSAWVMEGAYDPVAERLFNEAEVDRFLLEYDDTRSGGFEPLRFVPKGKVVVLGLVTTKTGALEDVDALCRRIDEAARFLPLDQLALSPQCGFASTERGNLLTHEEQRRKLALVVETARRVWG